MRTLIAGAGYTGSRVALQLHAAGDELSALVRSGQRAERLQAAGIDCIQADLDDATLNNAVLLRQQLAVVAPQRLLYTIPPPRSGGDDPRCGRLLQGLPASVRRVVYLSTTGVYGDCAGALVDESRAPTPASARAERRLAAEGRMASWCDAMEAALIVLRVPAIYGPGRLPLARLAAGESFPAPQPAVPGNRIHVDDLAAACLLALAPESPAGVYNLGDGDHCGYAEFLRRLATVAQLPPPQITAGSGGRAGFGSESRRIDTRRMREVLGLQPAFSDLDAGIRASLKDDPEA